MGSAARLMLVLVLAMATWPSFAADWIYRVRPGDNLWDVATRYLRSDIDWRRLQAHNGVADPYALPPGTRIKVPVAWLREQPEQARLVFVRGAVRAAIDADAREQSAAEGLRIAMGGWIETGQNASATVEFADGSRLMLSPNSRIVFDRLGRYGSTGMVDTRLRLQRGRATHRVEPQQGPASRYDVGTPSATSSVRGTRFRVGVQDGRETTEVLEGHVGVAGEGGRADLKGGFGSRNDGRMRVRALLPAPTLRDDAQSLDAMPLTLAWSAVDGAASYQVDVVRADAPEVQLAEVSVDAPQGSIDALPPGRYLVRARALDADGIAGMNAVRTVEVPAGPAPPLSLQPEDGEVVFQPRPRFVWSRSEGAVRTNLQIARDAAMREGVLELQSSELHTRVDQPLAPGRYWWRVAAEDADGRKGLFGESLPFEVAEPPADPGLSAPVTDDGKLVIRWRAFRDAPRYRVELSRRADFADIRVDETVTAPELRIARPGGGRWYVRVHASDEAGDEVPIGGVQEIRLPCRTCYIGAAAAVLLLTL
jgi:hypothetical protein